MYGCHSVPRGSLSVLFGPSKGVRRRCCSVPTSLNQQRCTECTAGTANGVRSGTVYGVTTVYGGGTVYGVVQWEVRGEAEDQTPYYVLRLVRGR